MSDKELVHMISISLRKCVPFHHTLQLQSVFLSHQLYYLHESRCPLGNCSFLDINVDPLI